MYFYSFFIKDPLEQFLVLPLPLIGKSFGLSNLTVTYFFVFCLILCFFLIVNSEPYYFNNRYVWNLKKYIEVWEVNGIQIYRMLFMFETRYVCVYSIKIILILNQYNGIVIK